MYGDHRPYPVALVTLDVEVVVPWAQQRGLPGDVDVLAEHLDIHDLVQQALDSVNSALLAGRADQALRDPRAATSHGDRRADADAEDRAQRHLRPLRGRLRRLSTR